MITTRLVGGLGNQLFQYATGRALAQANGVELQLDTRMLEEGTHASYALDNFTINAVVGKDLPPGKDRALAYGIWRAFGRNPRIIREKSLGFDPELLKRRGALYLHGYWQSEKYFEGIADALRQELTVISPPNAQNAEALSRIADGPSVSLHVRRGDYLSEDKNTNIYGTCDAAHYTAALEHIASKAGNNLTVYVFSNDPKWAEENLSFDFETHVFGHNGFDEAHEDLRLMAACDHNIIVNSTFSWWGAWLNPSPSKVVVAPSRWFNSCKMNNPDIIPQDWHQV